MDKSEYNKLSQQSSSNQMQSPSSYDGSKSFSNLSTPPPTAITTPSEESSSSPRLITSSDNSTNSRDNQQVAIIVAATKKDSFLAAPPMKSRRVRSNSPSVFSSSGTENGSKMVKSKSSQMGEKTNTTNNNVDSNLLSPNQVQTAKSSSKSIESTNSTTFSAGFLPSPDAQTPSNQSSMIGFNNMIQSSSNAVKSVSSNQLTQPSNLTPISSSNLQLPSGSSFCAVALATATIGSSILLTQEQQEILREQINQFKRATPSYTERASFKGNFLSFAQAAAKKLTTSSSLLPVILITYHYIIFYLLYYAYFLSNPKGENHSKHGGRIIIRR
jgi:hypothetical protein